MAKVKKLILVTADWAPLGGKVKKIVERIAREKGVELEERVEDWVFLKEHGEKDELGGADVPQVFVEREDGTIEHVMTKLPLDERGKPDEEKAARIVEEALGS